MEKETQKLGEAVDNPYRSPIFRRVSTPYAAGKDLTHTGLVMEWWHEQQLSFVDVFLHAPPKTPGTISLHQVVFRADQFASGIEVQAYTMVDVGGTRYFPLEVLFTALFESGCANRPFMTAVREFPHPEHELSKYQKAPQRGNLVQEIEDEGYELYCCDAATRQESLPGHIILPLFFWANPKCPVRAGEVAVTTNPAFAAVWVEDWQPGLAPLFTKELKRRFPDPTNLLTPQAAQRATRLIAGYKQT